MMLYLSQKKRILIHDVDNRLKDVLDALQGHFRDKKATRARRLFKNDNCVYRVTVEKRKVPKLYKNRPDDAPGGRLLIRPYRSRRWPLR